MSKLRRLSSGSNCGGFTLVELLVALTVSSIILTAVATLAYALSSANDTAGDTSTKQAQVRYTTLRISELIRHSKLICFAGPDDFALWRADDNDNGQINFSELVYIEKGAGADHLQICAFFPDGFDPVVNLSDVGAFSTNWWSSYNVNESCTVIIPQCSNAQFAFDVVPPQTRFPSISFDLIENDLTRQYQINGFVRGWAGNLLNQAEDALVSDDDQ